MEALKIDRRMTLFRATDAFAVEAFRASASFPAQTASGLAAELRRAALRSGGSLVAASASMPDGTEERQHLEQARVCLMEARYYLYLARRFGLLDLKRYRGLAQRQDAALKELDGILRPSERPLAANL